MEKIRYALRSKNVLAQRRQRCRPHLSDRSEHLMQRCHAKICCASGVFGINRGHHLDIWRSLRGTG
jgi:hypothetical protein